MDLKEKPPVKKRRVQQVQKATLDQPERFKMSEIGYLGSNIFNGVTNDEIKKELNFPASLNTFKNMSYHSTINAALTLYDNVISKADWIVRPIKDATAEEKQQAEFIRECMKDMDCTWSEFIHDVLSMNTFGFAVFEKVYRTRNATKGSKYNDGKIGWKKLALRNQESIEKFVFSDDGNKILGVKQNMALVGDPYNRYVSRGELTKVIPKSKILHFKAGKHRGDPYGKSPLRDAYLAWRYIIAIEEIEANGVAKDLSGFPILFLPPQYLAADASPEQKAIRSYYENAMANLQMNQQSSMILPQAFDPDTKQPLFKLELLSLDGAKGFDTVKVKEYYKNLILTSLFADILVMGQSETGSFALGQVKNSLTGAAVENMIRTIKDVLNHDLVKQTYELNGWDVSRMAEIDYENLEAIDAETFSKAVQRMGATGYLTKDLDVVNRVRESIGVDSLPEGSDFKALLPEDVSRVGDGMKTGTGNGTSTSVAGTDTSSTNADNTA